MSTVFYTVFGLNKSSNEGENRMQEMVTGIAYK